MIVFIFYFNFIKNLSIVYVLGIKLDDRDILDLEYCVGYIQVKENIDILCFIFLCVFYRIRYY